MTLKNFYIKDYDIGKINEELIAKCVAEKHFESEEMALKHYLTLILGTNVSSDISENIGLAREIAEKSGYRDIGELLSEYIWRDLRPINEVCATCKFYNNQFCAYSLCRTNPFEKGCEGWTEVEEKSDKIEQIFSAAKYFREYSDTSEVNINASSEEKNKVKAKDIANEEGYNYLLNIGNVHRANIINNGSEFAKITIYLFDLWNADRDPGMKLEERIDYCSDDAIIKYVNDLVEKWLSDKIFDDFDYACFPSVENSFKYYAHTVLEYIFIHPENKADFIDEIAKSFTDVNSYNQLISECFPR